VTKAQVFIRARVGARRLHTVRERLLRILEDEDLQKYIL
jgi:ATP-dependent protease HslVU (ClpYQ) ATPase subunit